MFMYRMFKVSDNFPFILMLDICVLDILFRQNTTFIKVPVAFVFELQTP